VKETTPPQPPDRVAAISARKRDHLRIALSAEGQSPVDPGWGDVKLVPAAVPNVDPDDVDLTTMLLGHRLAAPVVLAPMTGGDPISAEVNRTLGWAAEALGLAVGVGSQRAALVEPSLSSTYSAVRDRAPTAMVLANIGMSQLLDQADRGALTPAEVQAIVDMVGADALTVHFNVLQEMAQPEGDRSLGPAAPALRALVARCPVPVIAKETGSGIDQESASLLADCGVAALDVGGAGGTSFVRIEAQRAAEAGDREQAELGRLFAGWGIPAAASVLEAGGAGLPVIATGGIRNGLDAARALALGATCVGLGRVAGEAAVAGPEVLLARLERLLAELRMALVLCGARMPRDLTRRPPVLGGDTLEWARQRGLW
jgi:isopentenyl-diphosphate delta-isomerase